ncbi:MAG TPA: HPr kinase/phosphorylase [Caulobacteraceae bacterium]
MTAAVIAHAGLVALRLHGLWRGVLLQGPSGAGKSDLALRAISEGFRLIADDRTVIFLSGGRLFGRAPSAVAGLIEVRGLGVVETRSLPLAEIVVAVRCTRQPDDVERMPRAESQPILGLALPTLLLWPFEASAPGKLRRAMLHLGEHRQQAYQAARSSGALPAEGGRWAL